MSGHRRNSVISAEKRTKLINLVQNQGLSILRAGKSLGIKCSTAKQIVKRYKETGRFFIKSKCPKKTIPECSSSQNIQESSQADHSPQPLTYCYSPQPIMEYPLCYYLSPILCYYM